MCSIVASFDTVAAQNLCKTNFYRGALSHSITYFDLNAKILKGPERAAGPIDADAINIPNGVYAVIHQQAPTQQSKFIHPANSIDGLLWHNGILKPETIKRLQEKWDTTVSWDTLLLLKELETGDLNEVDGTFACIYHDGTNLFVFRNVLAPLFVDEKLTFSSTEFKGSTPLAHETIYQIDLHNRKLLLHRQFKTVENPYFFLD